MRPVTASDVVAAQRLIAGIVAAVHQEQLTAAARHAFLCLDEADQDVWRMAVARNETARNT